MQEKPVAESKEKGKGQGKELQGPQKNQEKSVGNVVVFKRINFLYQASQLMSAIQRNNETSENDIPSSENLSRYYLNDMKKLAERHVLRMYVNNYSHHFQ